MPFLELASITRFDPLPPRAFPANSLPPHAFPTNPLPPRAFRTSNPPKPGLSVILPSGPHSGSEDNP